MYRATKTYGTELGLSCCFRQWRATSHCKFLHGYSLGFKFVFEATELDTNGWVVDFGSLKPLKARLEQQFDHKLLVAGDDPEIMRFGNLHPILAQVKILPNGVGCERFAELAYEFALDTLHDIGVDDRVAVISAECMEHGANSAIYMPEGA